MRLPAIALLAVISTATASPMMLLPEVNQGATTVGDAAAPVLALTFNEGQGAKDWSWQTPSAYWQISGNPVYSGANSGYDLDGNDHLNLEGVYDSYEYQTLTVCAWVMIQGDAAGTVGGIVDFTDDATGGTGWTLQYRESDNLLRFVLRDGSAQAVQSNTAIDNDTWYHVCGVAASGVMSIYVNGVKQSSSDTYGTIAYVGTQQERIGQYASGFNHFLNGKVDDIFLFDRELTAAEIKQLYIAGKEQHP